MYLSDIRRAVGSCDTSTKAYNDVISKKHGLFKGKGDVYLEGASWPLIKRRLREVHSKDSSCVVAPTDQS